jgi:hypothetical protein
MGEKRFETRCWSTDYRGELAIHAAARLPPRWLGASSQGTAFRDELADVFNTRRDRDDRSGRHVDDAVRVLPYGAVLCIARLIAVHPIDSALRDDLPPRERIFGNYDDGRYAWSLNVIEVFKAPIPAKGNRMLWNWDGR